MAGTALLAWIFTIAGGALLAVVWVVRGGAKRPADADVQGRSPAQATVTAQRDRSRIGLSMIVTHATLALVGAVIWAMFSMNEDDMFYSSAKWLAVALLLAAIGVGTTMFTRWLADRRHGDDQRPEQGFPSLLVAVHGLGALATLVLVLAAAFA